MVIRFLTLIIAACLRDLIAYGVSLSFDATVSQRLPIPQRWACEVISIFVAVLIVDTIWLLAERVVSRPHRGDTDEAGRDGSA